MDIIGGPVRQVCLFAMALVLVISPAGAASTEDAKRDLLQTYDFDPSVMSFDEQATKAPTLGELWDRYDKAPHVYRNALRALLAQDGGREMLYCDGGMLLLEKAGPPEDRELGLKSIQKCSLSAIQQTPYFYTMHEQALAGVDTLDLQFKMLTRPKYQAFIPTHALTLGQDYSFVYPLLVQDETRYTSRLIEKIKTENDITALHTLLWALYYAATPEAEAAIHSIAQATNYPAAVQERAKLIEGRIGAARTAKTSKVREWINQYKVAITPDASEMDLRDGRRRRMHSISDEALMELDIYTLLIYQARKK